MGFRLTVAAGADAGARLAFDHAPVAIGRSSQCEVVVSDPAVSRRHARIVGEHRSYFLEDLRSSNGTKVNGAPIQRVRLSDGDELAVGSARFRFGLGAGGTTDRTSPDAPLWRSALARSAVLLFSHFRSVWLNASSWTRALLVAGLALAIFGPLAAVSHRVLAGRPKSISREPTVLSREPIEESFGLGEGVAYAHCEAKAFDFEFHPPGRAVVVLHFQSREISKDELVVTVNGATVGAVPPDLLDAGEVFHEMLIPPELLKKGEMNRVAFESRRNPPQRDAWRVWNLWIETNALPEMPPEQLLREAQAVFRRAELNFSRRDVAASNRYTAWKEYRSAWLTLQALPDPKPELYLRAQDRMSEAQRELDRVCATLMLHLQRSHSLKDWASARDAIDEVKSYFPGKDQSCPWKLEQRRAELKL